MKKNAILRGLLGFPLGISIGYVFTIFISLIWAQGYYSPCVPSLIETAGNEINAVIMQTLLCGVMGSAFSASSVIWEIEHWSIARQTGIYFLITALVMMPIAYFMNWMEHSILGFLIYFAIFFAIFASCWFVQYIIWKNYITKINASLK